MLLEVCVDSFTSAKRALDNGANRLEICGPLSSGGGTSASFALVRQIRAAYPHAPLMVMVRPRPGDFVYSRSEVELMLDEIDLFKTIQPPIQGVVFGCLNADGSVDTNSTSTLVARALPLQVTFHRAFDMAFYPPSPDAAESLAGHAIQALDDIFTISGITRVLTSALGPSMPASYFVFQQLAAYVAASERPLILLPGSGLNPTSLRAPVQRSSTTSSGATSDDHSDLSRSLLEALNDIGVREVHASCSSFVAGPTRAEARREGMGMGGWNRWEVDGAVVRQMRRLLDETGPREEGGTS